MDFCLKEDIKRNMKTSLNESKQQNSKIKITESELRTLIREAIQNILTDDDKQDDIDASWDAYEKTRQPISKYSIKGNLDTYLDGSDSWYDTGVNNYEDVMGNNNDYNDIADDIYNDYHEFAKDSDGFNGMQAQLDKPGHKAYYQDRYNKPKRNLEQYV